MIDLRSDTVTKPSAEMLKAMVNADLGDDVFGEDPTVTLLETELAKRFGMEAGLFCPSGTMTNQIAVMTHTVPGNEVICEYNCHVNFYEQGGMARNAGVSVNPIFGDRGVFTAADVEDKLRPVDDHFPTTKLVLVENTCNRGGGKVFPLENIKAIRKTCDANGLKLHLDGARIFNAIVASGVDPETYGQQFDSISICLSKGLGCPIGSVLVGSTAFIKKARRVRKVLGGGMRQAGIVAGAGIFALNNNIDRLSDDHARAKEIGQLLYGLRFVDSVLEPETNILVFKVKEEFDATVIATQLEKVGIGCFAVGENRIRFVFHLDISEASYSELKKLLRDFMPTRL